MCGPTQCGKTALIKDVIRDIDKVIKPTPDKLLYLYTAEQSNYDDIKQIIRTNAATSKLKTYEFIDCNQGIPSISELKTKLGDAMLLVLDDLMVIAASNTKNVENLNNIVSRDSHHTNTSVIFVSKFKFWQWQITKCTCE
jgi:predicted AAA+ superfamily ATPase